MATELNVSRQYMTVAPPLYCLANLKHILTVLDPGDFSLYLRLRSVSMMSPDLG